jgi:hypothetical protein
MICMVAAIRINQILEGVGEGCHQLTIVISRSRGCQAYTATRGPLSTQLCKLSATIILFVGASTKKAVITSNFQSSCPLQSSLSFLSSTQSTQYLSATRLRKERLCQAYPNKQLCARSPSALNSDSLFYTSSTTSLVDPVKVLFGSNHVPSRFAKAARHLEER